MPSRQSLLSDKKTNLLKGFVAIFMGVFALILGFYTLGIIIGILVIIVGIGLISAGIMNFRGYQTGNCPYCENEVVVQVNAKTCKCPHCKKISNHRGAYLITID